MGNYLIIFTKWPKGIWHTHKSLGILHMTVASDKSRYISILPMSLSEQNYEGFYLVTWFFSDCWFEISLYRNMVKQEKEIM